MQWGFECGSCGNDSRLAVEERDQIAMLVKGAENTIKEIAQKLKKGNEKLFKMEAI